MALPHIQAHPFYYPPHASFLFHSHNLQAEAPLPLPPSPSPLPPLSAITTKMAQAPPFVPQYYCSPRLEAPDALPLFPLVPAAPPTSMAHASFFLRSGPTPPPLPQVLPSLLPAAPSPVHQNYVVYQPAHPLVPASVASPTSLYYVSAAAKASLVEGATEVEPCTKVGEGEKPASGRWRAARWKPSGVPFPACRCRQRHGRWWWVTKEEAERRRHARSFTIRRSSATPSSSPSSSSSPSASTLVSATSSSTDSGAPLQSLEFDEALAEEGTRTTVMIKNIPNKYTREMLVKLLDDHCVEVNKKIKSVLALPSDAPPSEYDFVYLPMDFRTDYCRGYAFVNFTTPAAAWRFFQALDNHKWDLFGSKKIIHVCYARIQGKGAMLANFGASSFMCDSDGFLPVTFSPPRSGTVPCPPPTLVGKRWPRSANMRTAAAAAGSKQQRQEHQISLGRPFLPVRSSPVQKPDKRKEDVSDS